MSKESARKQRMALAATHVVRRSTADLREEQRMAVHNAAVQVQSLLDHMMTHAYYDEPTFTTILSSAPVHGNLDCCPQCGNVAVKDLDNDADPVYLVEGYPWSHPERLPGQDRFRCVRCHVNYTKTWQKSSTVVGTPSWDYIRSEGASPYRKACFGDWSDLFNMQ